MFLLCFLVLCASMASGQNTTSLPVPEIGQDELLCNIPNYDSDSIKTRQWIGHQDTLAYPNGICIVIVSGKQADGTYANMKKIVFFPKVDQFALLEVDQSYNRVDASDVLNLPDAFLRVEFGGAASEWKQMNIKATEKNKQGVVPYWTIISDVRDGVVNDLSWDDGCFFCDSEYCITDTCAVPTDQCVDTHATTTGASTDCDIKIYFGWFGTDKDGRYMISASKRLSAFRKYSVKSIYNDAADYSSGIDPPDLPDVDPF